MIVIFKRWKLFLFSALMYAILGASTSLLAALGQMTDEQFGDVITRTWKSRHLWILVLTSITAAITQVRALMNKDYHDAKGGGVSKDV